MQTNKESLSHQPEKIVVINGSQIAFTTKLEAKKTNQTRVIAALFLTLTDQYGNEYAILQKRSEFEDEFDGAYTFTASGHINASDCDHSEEPWIAAMKREGCEEVNLQTLPTGLIVHSFVTSDNKYIFVGHANITWKEYDNMKSGAEVDSLHLVQIEELQTNGNQYQYTTPFSDYLQRYFIELGHNYINPNA